MLRRQWLATAVLFAALPIAHAQAGNGSNRNDVRSEISKGGWEVVWGVTVNEAEYAKLVAATYSGNPMAYFSDYLERNIQKFAQNAPEVAENGVRNAILRAFRDGGRSFQVGKIGVKAGIATYRRWYTQKVPVGTERYKIHGPFGTWTWGYRPKFEERRISLPNHHQPYVAFRLYPTPSSPYQPSPATHEERLSIAFPGRGSDVVVFFLNGRRNVLGRGTVRQFTETVPNRPGPRSHWTIRFDNGMRQTVAYDLQPFATYEFVWINGVLRLVRA